MNHLNDIINNPEDFKKRINLEKKNEEYLKRINDARDIEELNKIDDDEEKYIEDIMEQETEYRRSDEIPFYDELKQNFLKIEKILNLGFRNIHNISLRKASSIDDYNAPMASSEGDSQGISIATSQGGKRKHKSRRNKKSKKSRKSKFRKNHRKSIRRRH
jgi:hypothetical protein